MLRVARCLVPLALRRNTLSAVSGVSVRGESRSNMAVNTKSQINDTSSELPASATKACENTQAAVTTLAISPQEDDQDIRTRYRPFLSGADGDGEDWVAQLELRTVIGMVQRHLVETDQRLKVLVLYGSLRQRSYSRLLAFEAARILFRLGCDARIYDPTELPVKDDVAHTHRKVQELRALSLWSDGHIWVSPEQHGNLTAVFKNQIDWIPLSTGSVRPTQGRTLAIAQVSGGSQSFNTVNSLRVLGRWMRMFTIPNQASVPMAYKQFTGQDGSDDRTGRMIPSSNRDRLVDVVEEFVKYTLLMRPHAGLFDDRYSERMEQRRKDLDKKDSTKSLAGSNGEEHKPITADGKQLPQNLEVESRDTVNGVNLQRI